MDHISIQGIHYHISETAEAYIREKLNKLSYLREHLVDGTLRVIDEKHEYAVEIDLHFNHGAKLHVQASHAQLYPAVENLMDKLKVAASDKKKKITDHRNHQNHQSNRTPAAPHASYIKDQPAAEGVGAASSPKILASHTHNEDARFMELAIEQARIGWDEGGIPIGAALVHEGRVLAVGRNRRVQMNSAIRHGETDCLENAGRLPASVYRRCTLYTTLSPCFMCAGTAVLYDIPRIVIGENRTFCTSEDWLRSRGVSLTVLNDERCIELMRRMIAERPHLWAEDIGEEA